MANGRRSVHTTADIGSICKKWVTDYTLTRYATPPRLFINTILYTIPQIQEPYISHQ